MSYQFRQVQRGAIPLLLGLAGGTGAGKTFSAMLLARGMAGGKPFAVIDTENGRAKHYADLFPDMRHAEITAPFRPARYAEAIAAGAAEYPVVIVDSMSHEWAGDGGCLDWHDEIMGDDQAKNLLAWRDPKMAHKRMVTRLLQVDAHVILCFRAEPKVEAVRDEKGKLKIVPKAALTGLEGWLPITEKMLPFELTASFLLMADRPGVPRPIKLEEQLRPLVPLTRPLDEDVGRRLADWARGAEHADESRVAELLELAAAISRDAHDRTVAALASHRSSHGGMVQPEWLAGQIAKARAKLARHDEPEPEPVERSAQFVPPEGAA